MSNSPPKAAAHPRPPVLEDSSSTPTRSRPTRLHLVGLGLVLLSAAGVLWMNWHRHGALAKERQLRRQSVAQGPYVRVSKVELAPAARAITVPGEVRAFQQAT